MHRSATSDLRLGELRALGDDTVGHMALQLRFHGSGKMQMSTIGAIWQLLGSSTHSGRGSMGGVGSFDVVTTDRM